MRADPKAMVDRVFGDRYQIIGSVGPGAVSHVFVAEDLQATRRVAIKLFDQSIGEDPDFADRVVARIARAAQVEHANIVKILDWGLDGVRLWVVSELHGGGSLRTLLQLGARLTPSQALVMSLELARALGYAHDQGLVHRGVKPENVLFSDDQRLRVSDFGLSDVLEEAPASRSSEAVERVRYLSPEQAGGEQVGPPADIYSLALVTNEAVCGDAPPVTGNVVGTKTARCQSPAPLSQQLVELRGPMSRAGRLEPDQRPEAEELTIGLLAAAEAMSRPGPLPLGGLPGIAAQDQASRVAARIRAVTESVEQELDPRQHDPEPIDRDELVAGQYPEAGGREPATGTVAGVQGNPPAASQEPGAADPVGAAESSGGPSASQVDQQVTATEVTSEPDQEFESNEAHQRNVGDVDRAILAVVPDVEDAPERVALEDLDLAEPTFGGQDLEAATLDVPTATRSSPGGVFRPDADDVDDELPLWPLIALVALVAAAIGGFLLFGRGADDSTVAVPALIGLSEGEVAAIAAEGAWPIERLEVRRNGTIPGTIVEQVPAPGVALADGESMRVTISLGAEMVEIPSDLPGLTLDQARERLRVAGLEVGEVTREASEGLEDGLVIGLDEPTRQKPQGEAVALRVSTGPDDRQVPNSLIGTTVADATATLVGLRLQGLEEQVYDPVAEVGTVLGTVPGPGQMVPADSQVTLLISAGPEPVEIPDLAELSLKEAVDALTAIGLIFVDAEGVPGEPVIGTIPPAGEIVDVGTEVTVIQAEPSDEDGDEDSDEDN